MNGAEPTAQCPKCHGKDCVQVDYAKAECLDCGEVFDHVPKDTGTLEFEFAEE